MRRYRIIKYLLLTLNLTLAFFQGILGWLHGFSESDYSWFWVHFHAAFALFFIYMGISGFKRLLSLERHYRSIDEQVERLMEELTIRLVLHRMNDENVNWKRDGF